MQIMLNSVYRFIAELNGYKSGTVSGKTQFGKDCYADRITPELTDDTSHEVIWLERIYDCLMRFLIHVDAGGAPREFHWDVPIELDASASMISFYGALLGDVRMLEMTNLLGDSDVLNDPWSIDGLPRQMVKDAATPILYGSSQTVANLWQNKNHTYTLEDLQVMNTELSSGAFGIANHFKEFLIRNCNPQPQMNIKIREDVFTINCNRFRNVGEETVGYDLYDTDSKSIKTIHHTKTKRVPDLEQFRRFFPTLLVHNADSQVANTVTAKTIEKYGFCIAIHDAFLVSPWAAEDVRNWYAEEMFDIYVNRKEILTYFFDSIGASYHSAEWERVQSMVHEVPYQFNSFRGEILK